MGPWVNSFRQNALAWMIVWSLVVLSLMLTAVTFFPNLSTATLADRARRRRRTGRYWAARSSMRPVGIAQRRKSENTVPFGALDLDQVEELEELPKLTRKELKAFRNQVRARWTTPALASLERPAISPLRRAGLLTLRSYLVIAGVMVVVKDRSSRHQLSEISGQQNDLAVGVPLLEFFESIGDPVERVGCGDVEVDCAGGDQVGDLVQHRRRRRLGAALGLRADLGGLRERDDGVDALGRHAKVDGELNVVRSEQVDKGIDAVRCGLAQSFGQPVAVFDWDGAVSA